MTSEDVQDWIVQMQASGRARFEKDCADLLGIHKVRLNHMKRNGQPKRIYALAMAALLHGLEPYNGAKPLE